MSRRLVAIDGLLKKGEKNRRAWVPDLRKLKIVYRIGRAPSPAKRFAEKAFSGK